MAQIVNNKFKILVHNKFVGHVARRNQKLLIHYQLGRYSSIGGRLYVQTNVEKHETVNIIIL